MKYYLVLLVLGIVFRNTLARGLNDAVLYDLERRLVRLEARQFSESQNLEHRTLQLETQKPKLKLSKVTQEKQTSEDTFLQMLSELENKRERMLEDLSLKFTSKYDSLSERFSAIEKHLEETNMHASLDNFIPLPKKAYTKIEFLEQLENIGDTKIDKQPIYDLNFDGSGSGYGELDFGNGF